MQARAAGEEQVVSVLFLAALQQSQTSPLPFEERTRFFREFKGQSRIFPNPKWIEQSWDARADGLYEGIQKEADAALASRVFSSSNEWAQKFRDAAQEYFKDYQNPVKLFRATTYCGVAKAVVPGFLSSTQDRKWASAVNRGWEYLDKPPKSYLFARRGYIFNSNDMDCHFYGDLAVRLLQARNADKSVALAMLGEYYTRDDTAFVRPMFQTLEKLRVEGTLVRWEPYVYARGVFLRWQRHKNPKDLDLALQLTRTAIQNTPKNVSSTELVTFQRRIEDAMR